MKILFILLTALCLNRFAGREIIADNSEAIEFVGSTPYNKEVKLSLQIPAIDSFDFMKWKLKITSISGDAGDFDLKISYGYYLQNTPDFQGGGKAIHFSGKWKLSPVSKNNTRYQIYQLSSSGNGPHLNLLKMDSNILHLIDDNGKPYPGDASFGFILNRYPAVQNK